MIGFLGIGFFFMVLFVILFHESDDIPVFPAVFLWVGCAVYNHDLHIVWHLALDYYVRVALLLLTYLFFGLLWTVPKLWFYVRRPEIKTKLRQQVNRAKGMSNVEVDKTALALDFLITHKWKMYLWATYWPVNIVSTLARDPLRVLYTWAWDHFVGVYSRTVVAAIDGVLQQQ